MELILASAGSYPRSGPAAELQVLVNARSAVARGEKTAADISDAENFMIRRAIEEQVSAGLELVTDGLTRWLDPVSHLAGKLEGVHLAAQRPLPGGGSFRVPVLRKRPVRRAPLLTEEYRFASNALGTMGTPHGKAGKLSVKAVLTGPFTLAKFSEAEDPAMASLDARAEAFAAALAAEIGPLAEGGAEHIQVDEFAPPEGESDWRLLARALQPLAAACEAARRKGRRVELTLSLQFPGVAAHYDGLANLSTDLLALDLATEDALYDRVAASGAPKPLHLGLISHRNPELENTRDLARKLEALLPKLPSGRAYLGPAGGLDALSRERAREKLALVARVREIVSGHPASP
jgi:methionine synthase II (cobalamin-independent)